MSKELLFACVNVQRGAFTENPAYDTKLKNMLKMLKWLGYTEFAEQKTSAFILQNDTCTKFSDAWFLDDSIAEAVGVKQTEDAYKSFRKKNCILDIDGVQHFVQTAKISSNSVVLIAGFCTDTYVLDLAKAVQAMQPTADIIILEDCCAGTNRKQHKIAVHSGIKHFTVDEMSFYGISGNEWAGYLSDAPGDFSFCDKWNGWDRMQAADWIMLLSSRPTFASRCKIIGEFTEEQWKELIHKHPSLAKYRKPYKHDRAAKK